MQPVQASCRLSPPVGPATVRAAPAGSATPRPASDVELAELDTTLTSLEAHRAHHESAAVRHPEAAAGLGEARGDLAQLGNLAIDVEDASRVLGEARAQQGDQAVKKSVQATDLSPP